ncbi:hypothetical protein DH2020_003427 [Rehmannia glutinosa]|uniref:Glucose/Sorbosone dehydrogenase domain-containing protein n=1 Tax=Rehmannia glutinosa TaxID=99300 RepID=A0ABR0XLM4_REHGL
MVLCPFPSSSFPLCTDLRAPTRTNGSLAFCPYNGKACCNPSQDLQLQKRFQAMNISDSACASAVKSVLCATCDPFSAKLFTVDSEPRPVPILCNSTAGTSVSSLSTNTNNNTNFCSTVWESCQDVLISNSLRPCIAKQSCSSTKRDFIQINRPLAIKTYSATHLVAPLMKTHFASTANLFRLTNRRIATPQRAFVSRKLAMVLISTWWLTLMDQTFWDDGNGVSSGFCNERTFFCAAQLRQRKVSGCGGRCACNSDVDCDPSQIGSLNAGEVCKYHTVIAEYSANGTAASPSMAERARPQEIRRIFTLGLPFTANHGGQILFGPGDGYLYIMMGDGGSKGEEEIAKLGRWGNYSVPQDNPFSEDKEMEPEIWAYGLRNPWRCSFDSERPSYFLCADVGQPQSTPGGNTSANSIDPIFPVVGYSHSNINKLGSAAISGGYVYRSQTDPCTHGSYLYGDLYASHIWAASESPADSGNFTSNDISFSCAPDSPIKCDSVPNSNVPALEYIFSFGEDNRKDVYILTQSGVYRVVRPSRCSYACSKEVAASTNPPSVPSHGHCFHPHSVIGALDASCMSKVGALAITALLQRNP